MCELTRATGAASRARLRQPRPALGDRVAGSRSGHDHAAFGLADHVLGHVSDEILERPPAPTQPPAAATPRRLPGAPPPPSPPPPGIKDGSSAPSTIASTPRRRASSTIACPARRVRTVAVATC